jgi:hypothetical protein
MFPESMLDLILPQCFILLLLVVLKMIANHIDAHLSQAVWQVAADCLAKLNRLNARAHVYSRESRHAN